MEKESARSSTASPRNSRNSDRGGARAPPGTGVKITPSAKREPAVDDPVSGPLLTATSQNGTSGSRGFTSTSRAFPDKWQIGVWNAQVLLRELRERNYGGGYENPPEDHQGADAQRHARISLPQPRNRLTRRRESV